MIKYKCTECGSNFSHQNIIITIDNNGNEILHCPSCYSKETLINELTYNNKQIEKFTDEL